MSEPRPTAPRSIRRTATGVEVLRADAPAPAPPPLDPAQILAENQRIEARYAKAVDTTPPRSHRGRDYWIVLLLGNALLAGLIAILPKNPVVLLFGLSGIVMFSAGITWVMWVVMGDY